MMNKDNPYFKQADLLLEILPLISHEKDFAIKGGTAINFFIRDLPRLSVDIDLCYLPVTPREFALTDIHQKMLKLRGRIAKRFQLAKFADKMEESKVVGFTFSVDNLPIKVEPNLVIRGTVFPSIVKPINQKAADYFQKYAEAQILSVEDLYAGKICAALDRQHPRDLYDVKLLMDNEGITENLKRAFIIYLLSHPRPIIEILNPGLIDISGIFVKEFDGMTLEKISLDELIRSRTQLVDFVRNSLSDKDRLFIATFKNKKPNWELFPLPDVNKLPAIQWKLLNLRRMDKEKHKEALNKLLNFLKVDERELK